MRSDGVDYMCRLYMHCKGVCSIYIVSYRFYILSTGVVSLASLASFASLASHIASNQHTSPPISTHLIQSAHISSNQHTSYVIIIIIPNGAYTVWGQCTGSICRFYIRSKGVGFVYAVTVQFLYVSYIYVVMCRLYM
jgi:hypothetical protein